MCIRTEWNVWEHKIFGRGFTVFGVCFGVWINDAQLSLHGKIVVSHKYFIYVYCWCCYPSCAGTHNACSRRVCILLLCKGIHSFGLIQCASVLCEIFLCFSLLFQTLFFSLFEIHCLTIPLCRAHRKYMINYILRAEIEKKRMLIFVFSFARTSNERKPFHIVDVMWFWSYNRTVHWIAKIEQVRNWN